MSNNSNEVLIDFYDGAYGPTIRIAAKSAEYLSAIRNVFVKLAESKNYTFDLAELKNAKTIRLNQLILNCIPENQETKKKLFLISNNKTGADFKWAMASQSWEKVVDLIDGLLNRGSSGHQYLTREGVDDALIELSFMESR